MSTIGQTYRLFALIMALLMLSTSVGLAVDMHFCGGKLVSISFFGEADNCMKPSTGETGCRTHYEIDLPDSQLQISKKACCEDRFFQIKAEQNQNTEHSDWRIQRLGLSSAVALHTFFIPFLTSAQNLPDNINYQPPPRCRLLYVFSQSFLL